MANKKVESPLIDISVYELRRCYAAYTRHRARSMEGVLWLYWSQMGTKPACESSLGGRDIFVKNIMSHLEYLYVRTPMVARLIQAEFNKAGLNLPDMRGFNQW